MLSDLIANFLGEVLPGDLGETARIRRYKKGGRVVFPGRVEGVRGVPSQAYLVAQRGQLWVTNHRKDETNLVPVPPPKPEASIEAHKGTRKDSFHLSYESDGGGVRIYPWMNRFLLERVLEEARGPRASAPDA